MITKVCFCCVMRTLVFVTASNTLFPQLQTNWYTCCIIPFWFNCKLRFTKVWIPDLSKVLSIPHKAHMHRRWLLSAKNLGKSDCAWISKLLTSLLFVIHSLYCKSMKLYKLLKLQYSLPHSIWLRVIYSWLWMRLTFIKQLSVQGLQVCTSSLICLLDSLMQVLVFIASWGCVLGINSILCSCSTSMISASLAALSTKCWTGSLWCLIISRISISRLSQRSHSFFNQVCYSWVIIFLKMGFHLILKSK